MYMRFIKVYNYVLFEFSLELQQKNKIYVFWFFGKKPGPRFYLI